MFFRFIEDDVSVLVVATGVGSCGWTISTRAVIVDVALWQFSNSPPNSASVVDAMTFIIMLHYTCTGPFFGGIDCMGIFDFGPRTKYPPALLRAYGSDVWDASEYMWRIIMLLMYSITASVCVAL